MQKFYTTSFSVIIQLSFSILLVISLLFLFIIKSSLTVRAGSDNEVVLPDLTINGNVGIGVNDYNSTPSATPSATPVPSASPSADLTPPAVNITSPQFGSLVTGIVQVLADAVDNVAVDRVEFYVDGGFLGIGASAPNYSFWWDTVMNASDGVHILSAKAIDTSGNEASSSAISVTVDNTPPVVNLFSPVNGSLVSGVVTLQASAWDSVSVNRVDFYVDGAIFGSSSISPYVVSWDTSALPAGSTYTIQAKAYDQVGHETVSNSAQVTVADTTAPTVSVTSPLEGATVSGKVSTGVNASDDVGVVKVEFYADGSLLTTVTSAPYAALWDTTIYPNNSAHTLTAKAYDAAGNQANSTISVTVSDITPPAVVVTYPTNGATVPKNSTVTITANASDVSGIGKVEFYVNNSLKCTDTASAYSCNWFVPAKPRVSYNLQAKAYDTAGNISTSSITVTSK